MRRCTFGHGKSIDVRPTVTGKAGRSSPYSARRNAARVLVTGMFPHIPGNGPFTPGTAVPLQNGGVNVGLGRIAFFRPLRRGHGKSGGLFALRFINLLYLFLLRREET